MLPIDFEDRTQLGMRLAAIPSAVKRLQLTAAARNRGRDAVRPKGRKRLGSASASGALQLSTNMAEATVDNKGGDSWIRNAVCIVGTQPELDATDDARRRGP